MATATSPAPTAANPGGAWYDPLASLALAGLDSYTRIAEARASAKPNNVTTLRSEEVNPATGTIAGVRTNGTAGVTVSNVPSWLMPVGIGLGGVALVGLLFAALRRK